MERAIVLLSGGIDSAVTLWWAKARGWDLRAQGIDNRLLLDSPEGYIPGRNLIFYALAGYYAELDAVRYIVGGHNGIDPESFPDASPKFFNFLNSVFHLSLWSYDKSP